MAKLSIAELLSGKGESTLPVSNCRLNQIPIETTELSNAIHLQPCRKPDDVIDCETVRFSYPRFNPDDPNHLSFIRRGRCFSGSCIYSSIRIPGDTGL